MKGLFIAIDGIDGCGSTTHTYLLGEFLEKTGLKVHLTHEPSKSEIGVLLRKFLTDNSIPATTDALLFAADRDLHFHNEIKKKLEEGFIVISDRYIESSIIYQSVQSDDITIDWVEIINKFVGTPDLTIILDLDPEVSLSRKPKQELEKFEELAFLKKVRQLYVERAKNLGYSIVNSNDIIENVQQKVIEIVKNKFAL